MCATVAEAAKRGQLCADYCVDSAMQSRKAQDENKDIKSARVQGTAMIRMTGGEALLRAILAEPVSHVFGIVGGKWGTFMKPLAQSVASGVMSYVGTRHEAAAAHMAAAMCAATGRMAVCFAECGPGAGNLVSGVASAYNNNLPLLALTSNPQHAASYPDNGMLMAMDTLSLFRPITKWNATIHDGLRIPELVRTAFRQALTGRPGPVHLDIPQDILVHSFEFDAEEFVTGPQQYRPLARPVAAADAIREAVALIAAAERPLFVAGGGAVVAEASSLCRELVALTGAAATTTQMGLGVIASDAATFIGHGGIIGGPAIVRAFAEADLVIAVGCRFSSWLADDQGSLVKRQQRLLHLNIDPNVLGSTAPLTLGLWGDAAETLNALLKALKAQTYQTPVRPWVSDVVADYRAYRAMLHGLPDEVDGMTHPAALAREIAALLPADALVAYDGGHTTFWSNDLTPAYTPRSRFHDPGMGQLGFGLPFALAAKLAQPDKAVFNITGDGAFGFTLQELDTARRYGLPVINIIHNNAAWGVIQLSQNKADFALGTDLSGTDYAAIARGFGCHGETVNTLAELPAALDRALASGLPAVLDCRVFFAPHPCMPAFGKMNSVGINRR